MGNSSSACWSGIWEWVQDACFNSQLHHTFSSTDLIPTSQNSQGDAMGVINSISRVGLYMNFSPCKGKKKFFGILLALLTVKGGYDS